MSHSLKGQSRHDDPFDEWNRVGLEQSLAAATRRNSTVRESIRANQVVCLTQPQINIKLASLDQ